MAVSFGEAVAWSVDHVLPQLTGLAGVGLAALSLWLRARDERRRNEPVVTADVGPLGSDYGPGWFAIHITLTNLADAELKVVEAVVRRPRGAVIARRDAMVLTGDTLLKPLPRERGSRTVAVNADLGAAGSMLGGYYRRDVHRLPLLLSMPPGRVERGRLLILVSVRTMGPKQRLIRYPIRRILPRRAPAGGER